MDRRLELDKILREILNITDPIDGDRHTYFNPPESVKMKYPAIRYSLNGIDGKKANDKSYLQWPSYKVILIDKNSDSEYVQKLLSLEYCTFITSYPKDNLHHFVFTIY
jgi:hypothetical protein